MAESQIEKRILYFKSNVLREDDLFYVMDHHISNNKNKVPHTHDFYEFFIVTEGEIVENFNGIDTILGKYQVHLVMPDDSHMFRTSSNYEKNKLRNIAVNREYFEIRLKDFGCKIEQLNRRMTFDSDKFHEMIAQTDLAIMNSDNAIAYRFILSNVLDKLLINARFQIECNDNLPAWLKKLYKEMTKPDNYIAGITRMQELSGKSKGHLTRSFQKYYHMTPTRFINMYRLQYSVEQLKSTDKKIIDIIYESGFESVAYFNKIFKERYFLTPREFRNRNIF